MAHFSSASCTGAPLTPPELKDLEQRIVHAQDRALQLDPDNAELVAVANQAIDLGMNQFDGADAYGDGKCEVFFNRILKPRRSEVTVVSKFGIVRRPDGTAGVNARPEYVRSACDASLKRLGMDCIDLWYLHRMPADVSIEESVGAMAELVAERERGGAFADLDDFARRTASASEIGSVLRQHFIAPSTRNFFVSARVSTSRNRLAFSMATARCSDIAVKSCTSSVANFLGDLPLKRITPNIWLRVLIGMTAKKPITAISVRRKCSSQPAARIASPP